MNKTLPARVQRCDSERPGASPTPGRAVRREKLNHRSCPLPKGQETEEGFGNDAESELLTDCAPQFLAFESNLLRDDDRFNAYDVRTTGVRSTP